MKEMRKGIAAAILLTILLFVLAFAFASDVHAEIRLSEAPMEYEIIGIQRVDVDLYSDPARVKIEIPVLETDEYAVLITDGYHIAHAYSVTPGNGELFCLFHTRDLGKMDGTVGIYLVWLAKAHNE